MNTRGGRRSPSLSPPSRKTSKRKHEDGKKNGAKTTKNGGADGSPDKDRNGQQAADSDDSQSESGQSSTSRVSTASKRRGHVQSLGFGSTSSLVDISQSPSKRSKSNQAPADTETERKWYSTIKSVLTKQYFDVVGRLLLDFQPGCLSNLEYCAQYHSRNGVNINIDT